MPSITDSPNIYARLAGLFYLSIIALGMLGQLVVRDGMIDYSNAAQTTQNLLNAPHIWRLGAAGDVLMQVLDVPVMIILYFLLRPVSKVLATISVAFNLAQTAVLAANKLIMLTPAIILSDGSYTAAFSQEQVNAQVLLLADLHDYGFGLGLVFFGFATIGYGTLIYLSGYLPKFVGVLMIIAGTSYLINSFTLIVYPALSGTVFPILFLSFCGELCFALWLVVKGVDMGVWSKAVQR